MHPGTRHVDQRDAQPAGERRIGHVVLALFAVTLVLLLVAYAVRDNLLIWAAALAAWVLHDAAVLWHRGRLTKPRTAPARIRESERDRRAPAPR